MLRSLLLSLLCMFIWSPSSAEEQPKVTDLDLLSTQIASPDHYSLPAISPDGTRLAVVEFENAASISIYKIAEDATLTNEVLSQATVPDGAPFAHNRYTKLRWLTNNKLMVLVSTPRLNRSTGVVSHYHHYMLLDVSKHTLEPFLSDDFPVMVSRTWFSQSNIVRWPRRDGEPLLMALRTISRRYHLARKKYWYPSVFAIDADDLATEFIQGPKDKVFDWVSDQDGNIRIAYKYEKDGTTGLLYREAGKKKWRNFSEAKFEPGKVFQVIEFSEEPNRIFVISNHENDKAGLYLYDLESQAFGELIADHERYDVTSIRRSVDGELEVVLAGDVYAYLSQREQNLLEVISEQTEFDRMGMVDRDRSDHRRIYELSSSNDPGGFFLFDTRTHKLTKLFDRLSAPDGEHSFGQTSTHDLEARDGLKLEAFLALPAGYSPETAKHLPFVLMPHGGPWARDFATFDPLTQYITSMGIGVLKVNFRGSEGYGKDFEELGVGEWGQAMQADLNDALTWAVQKEWIDPDRVCIVGWSYGGYASMMAAIEDSDRYQCAGSIAGVTDLVRLIRFTRDEEVLRRIGARHSYDVAAVERISPKHRAEEIGIPVFLAHGSGDRVANIQDHYAAFLKTLNMHGKDVDRVAFLNGDHSLSAPADRKILYERLGLFLEKHILFVSE